MIQQKIGQCMYIEEGTLARAANTVARVDSSHQCLIEMRDDGLSHNNINPETIVVTNGKFRLYHPWILETLTSNISNALLGRKSFISPELYHEAMVHEVPKLPNGTASDIFSLGLSLVEAASLEPETTYYTLDGKLNDSLVRNKIRKVSHVYSKDFVNLLCRMVISSPEERIDV